MAPAPVFTPPQAAAKKLRFHTMFKSIQSRLYLIFGAAFTMVLVGVGAYA